jgi:ribosomal protein L29
MAEERPAAKELVGLRRFLHMLESGEMRLTSRHGTVDDVPREIEILKREIAHLGTILARSGVTNA